jgi:hypothetical protein
VNIQGPFGESTPSIFGMTATGLMKTHDRPEVTHRGVRVMRHDAHDLTQTDEYPDATGWYTDDDGQLDVRNEDSKHHVVASYPSGSWKRVWFPGAEVKTQYVLPEPDDNVVLPGEDENGEFDDIPPMC